MQLIRDIRLGEVIKLSVLILIACSSGCHGRGGSNQNPLPTLTSIAPTSATAGGAAFMLTANGTLFSANATVQWNGSARTTTVMSSTRISAAITAADIATAGTAQVTVTNPAPGGGTSSSTAFVINPAPNPIPAVANISPANTEAGGPAFALTVNGTQFTSSSVVQWNGAAQPTVFVNSGQLTAQIPAANILAAGSVNVTVQNPPPGGGASNAAVFTISAAAQTIGIIQQISVARDGSAGNGESLDPAISVDGTYVEFQSAASNLVAADSNGTINDVFSRTTCVQPGAPGSCTPTTQLDSLTTAGGQLQNGGFASETGAFMSSDGRFVAFEGALGDVVAGASTHVGEVFLRDTCRGQSSGCTPTTVVASLDDLGQPVNGITSGASNGAISGNGRVVVFSSANKVVSGVPAGGAEIFAHDTCFGVSGACTPSTYLVSSDNGGVKGNSTDQTEGPSLSDDGRYVAFFSDSTNLVAGDTNNRLDVFVRDTCVGAPAGCTPQTRLVSANAAGGVGSGGSNGSYVPSLSGNGRFVLFQSDATDLVAASNNGVLQIYLRDTCIGAAAGCTPTTTLVTADSTGHALTSPSSLYGQGNISSTGRYLLFGPGAPLNAGDMLGQAYVRDTCFGALSGCTPKTNLISVDSQGQQIPGGVRPMAISGDGRVAVLFDGTSQLYLALTGF